MTGSYNGSATITYGSTTVSYGSSYSQVIYGSVDVSNTGSITITTPEANTYSATTIKYRTTKRKR